MKIRMNFNVEVEMEIDSPSDMVTSDLQVEGQDVPDWDDLPGILEAMAINEAGMRYASRQIDAAMDSDDGLTRFSACPVEFKYAAEKESGDGHKD